MMYSCFHELECFGCNKNVKISSLTYNAELSNSNSLKYCILTVKSFSVINALAQSYSLSFSDTPWDEKRLRFAYM